MRNRKRARGLVFSTASSGASPNRLPNPRNPLRNLTNLPRAPQVMASSWLVSSSWWTPCSKSSGMLPAAATVRLSRCDQARHTLCTDPTTFPWCAEIAPRAPHQAGRRRRPPARQRQGGQWTLSASTYASTRRVSRASSSSLPATTSRRGYSSRSKLVGPPPRGDSPLPLDPPTRPLTSADPNRTPASFLGRRRSLEEAGGASTPLPPTQNTHAPHTKARAARLAVAKLLHKHPKLRLRIHGYAQPDAPDMIGEALAQARAVSVRRRLLASLSGRRGGRTRALAGRARRVSEPDAVVEPGTGAPSSWGRRHRPSAGGGSSRSTATLPTKRRVARQTRRMSQRTMRRTSKLMGTRVTRRRSRPATKSRATTRARTPTTRTGSKLRRAEFTLLGSPVEARAPKQRWAAECLILFAISGRPTTPFWTVQGEAAPDGRAGSTGWKLAWPPCLPSVGSWELLSVSAITAHWPTASGGYCGFVVRSAISAQATAVSGLSLKHATQALHNCVCCGVRAVGKLDVTFL